MKKVQNFIHSESFKNFKDKLIKVCFAILALIVVGAAGYIFGVVKGGNIKEDRIIRTINASVNENYDLSDWEVLQMAIIKTESEFNRFTLGSKNDIGIFQITPIYVAEVNRLMGEHMYDASDAYSVEKSLEMFDIMQRNHNKDHDIDKAIHSHNPKGGSIGYFKKVYENVAWIKRMEEVRKEIVLFDLRKRSLQEAENTITIDTLVDKK